MTPVRRRRVVTTGRIGEAVSVFGMIAGILAILSIPFTCLAALITHVVICIQTANWILLLFGIFAFPVGIIHGIGSWFGAF